MARMFVDCRDSERDELHRRDFRRIQEELLDAAVQHAVAVHGHHDSPELRQELAKMIKTQ